MWTNRIRVRVPAFLVRPHELEVDGFDQKPPHMNEAGSKAQPTLAFRGEPEIRPKENHSATRCRWTATTFVTSPETRAAEIPPSEARFKGGPQTLAQAQGERPDDAPWLSVTTTPSGSYKIDDCLGCLERCLRDPSEAPPPPRDAPSLRPQAGVPDLSRRWRILNCDAYTGHDEHSMRKLAWRRGYVLIKHGGGTTGQAQVNDTHTHGPISKDYQDLEQTAALLDLQVDPNGCPNRSRGDCVHDLCTVWRRPELHARGVKGHKENHLTTALDGSEDHLASSSIAALWKEIGMDAIRDQSIEEVCTAWEGGMLEWRFEDVYSLVDPMPVRGVLDVPREYDDDEGSDDGGGEDPWDDDPGGSPMQTDSDSEPAPAGAKRFRLEDPVAADEAQGHIERLHVLDGMIENAVSLGNFAIETALRNARRRATKDAHGSSQANARVAAVVRQAELDEDTHHAELRQARLAAKALQHQSASTTTELQSLAAEVRQQHTKLRERELALVRSENAAEHTAEQARRRADLDAAPRQFDLEMLGGGLPAGGTCRHRQNRSDLLERIKRAAPELPVDYEVNWTRFKESSCKMWNSTATCLHDPKTTSCTQFSKLAPCRACLRALRVVITWSRAHVRVCVLWLFRMRLQGHWDRKGRGYHDRTWAVRVRNRLLEVIVGLNEGDDGAFRRFVRSETRIWKLDTCDFVSPLPAAASGHV